MASSPNYAATPKAASVIVSTANTNRDGTGTITTVLTAGTLGSRVDLVIIQATVTTTQGMIRLWVHNGTASFLIQEILVDAITPSASVMAFNTSFTFNGGLQLPAGWSLRASTHNAQAFHVTAIGGDF